MYGVSDFNMVGGQQNLHMPPVITVSMCPVNITTGGVIKKGARLMLVSPNLNLQQHPNFSSHPVSPIYPNNS